MARRVTAQEQVVPSGRACRVFLLVVIAGLVAAGCAGVRQPAVLVIESVREGAVVELRPEAGLDSVLAFLPDGRHLVCRTTGLTVCVLDAVTGRRVFAAGGAASLAAGDKLLDYAPIPEGLHEISVFDLSGEPASAGATPIFRWRGKALVQSVALSEDGLFLAAGSDNSICVWDLKARRQIRVLPDLKEGAQCVAFSPNGLVLASVGSDKTVSLWDLAAAERLKTVRVGEGEISFDCFSADGRSVVLRERRMVARPAGYRGLPRLALRTVVVEVSSGQVLLDIPDYAWVSGDRKTLVRRDDEGSVCVHGLSSGRQLGRIAAVGPLALSQGAGLMAVCTGVSEGRRVFEVWNLAAMTKLASCWVPEDSWYCRVLSPDGGTLVLKRGCGLRLAVVDVRRNAKLVELASAVQGAPSDLGERVAFSPDGGKMATACGGSLLTVDVGALEAALDAEPASPG